MIITIALGVLFGKISYSILLKLLNAIFQLQQKLPYHLAVDKFNNLRLYKKAKSDCDFDEPLVKIIPSKYL